MHIQRHAVLVGIGKIGIRVFNALPTQWSITVIDKDLKQLNKIPDVWGGKPVTKLCADGTSRLVLQEANLVQTSLLAVLTQNDETNAEVVRMAREHFLVEEIFLVQRNIDAQSPFEQVQEVNIHSLVANRVSHLMKGTLSAQGIGQEKGEIRQILVLNSSPARGLSLRELNPQTWKIAAIYREDELILPCGDTIIKAGDNVVVVGEPKCLETEIQFLQGGQILFPTQYGNTIGYIDPEKTSDVVGIFLEKIEATSTAELRFEDLNLALHSSAEIRQKIIQDDIGMMIMPPQKIPWRTLWGFGKSSVMHLMFHTQIPFLLSKGGTEFKRILLCVKSNRSTRVLGTIAFDLTRQFEAELTVLSVFTPNIDMQQREKTEALPANMEKLARSHGVPVIKKHREGNPIKEICAEAANYDLLIIGYSKQERSTIMNPDISLHLHHKAPCSILFVPWQTAGR